MFSLLTCLNLIHCCLREAKEINIFIIHACPMLEHLLPYCFLVRVFFLPINLAGNISIPKMFKSVCLILFFKPAFARLSSRTRCTLCPVKIISHLLISLLVKNFLFIRPEHHFFTLHIQALCSMEGPLQLANDGHGSRGNQVSWNFSHHPVLPQGPSVLSF